MILVDLQLENYKQYAGEHQIEFPEQGAVAIIGNNGVGKTTLFEAIEWCLYNPRQIPTDEVPPRGGVGDTKVTLVLEDPRDGIRYVVERWRRRRGVEAEVYRQDQPDVPIVKGTRDVTEYVKHRLIGLSHRAFVSTFFTRQKELSFFGDLKETDRRREVAQLLGFETIRAAQTIIGNDRAAARTEHLLLAHQYEDERRDRDFAAELAEAESAIAAARAALATATDDLDRSEVAHLTARTNLGHWTELERRDATLARETERLAGDLRAAEADFRNAEASLAQLTILAQDRLALLPRRAAEPESRRALQAQDAARERYLQWQTRTQTLHRTQTVMDDVVHQARHLQRTTDTRGLQVANWCWPAGDDIDPEPALARLIAAIDDLDPRAEADRAARLDTLIRAATLRDQAQTKVRKYQDRLDDVRRGLERLRKDGDPEQRIGAIGLQRDEANGMAQNAITLGEEYASRQAGLEQAVTAIRSAAQQPECPTCHRPLSAEDAELAIAPLLDQIAECKGRRQDAERQRRAAERSVAEADQALESERQRLKQLQSLEGSLTSGIDYVRTAEEDFQRQAEECRTQLVALGRKTEPTPDEAREAASRAEVTRLVASRRGVLVHLRDQFAQARSEHESAQAEIAALGEVAYDPNEHQEAKRVYDDIRDAIARLNEIERTLANHEQYERQRAAAGETIAAVSVQFEDVRGQRAALGFDRAQLEAATLAEREAAGAARQADRALSAARNGAEHAIRERDALAEEHRRIEQLARRAESRRRDHDELDRMYREFSRFDQYVAQLVTPQLADYTGELLAEVTDHKYDHVAFDDNYGLRIFDGPEHFAIDQFSGGERDVAALCARLALSRFIGSQAAHPPQFLVLDEVFGSLDADRRAHVLGALLQLAGADGPFRQLFIISHVDDVRTSPALDEIWRVREVDGGSKVENISRSLSVEDV